MSNLPMDQHHEQLRFIEVSGRRIATTFHAAPGERVVIFCHGFLGSKLGPRRCFVRLARQLQERDVCTLRFDQYGSGDSAGDFFDSSFDEWITTTKALVRRYREDGYRVALLGQSMGGATVLAVAGDLGAEVASVVAWAPDPSVDPLQPGDAWSEEEGQRVRRTYWQEAHDADIIGRFRAISAPTLVFVPTDDDYVSAENRQALLAARRAHQRIEVLAGWPHSAWTYDQATRVIDQSADFLVAQFQ
ncbi:MAG TPA: alpha/beta fold hydrolase [Thermomicrobiales bacterium]|nr:alpha/beta fold hydrolase [Thermomicrobiales bacterium]